MTFKKFLFVGGERFLIPQETVILYVSMILVLYNFHNSNYIIPLTSSSTAETSPHALETKISWRAGAWMGLIPIPKVHQLLRLSPRLMSTGLLDDGGGRCIFVLFVFEIPRPILKLKISNDSSNFINSSVSSTNFFVNGTAHNFAYI